MICDHREGSSLFEPEGDTTLAPSVSTLSHQNWFILHPPYRIVWSCSAVFRTAKWVDPTVNRSGPSRGRWYVVENGLATAANSTPRSLGPADPLARSSLGLHVLPSKVRVLLG